MKSFSKPFQRQYICLHSLKILGDHIEKCMKGKVPAKILACLERIEQRRLALLKNYSPTDKQGRTVIRKWLNAVKKYKDDGAWISPVEYINACLVLVNDVYDEGAKPKNEWRLLTQGLFTLCKHLDPELNSPDQDQGMRLGELVLKEFK